MHVVCPDCAATNNVPQERLNDQPVCGRCGAELLAPKPVALSDASFTRYTSFNDAPVLVDFWAAWCGPCRMMAPQFEQAATQLPEVRFAKLDTDANPQAGTAARIRSIPTIILYLGGRELARHSGVMAAGDLVRWVRGQLAPTT